MKKLYEGIDFTNMTGQKWEEALTSNSLFMASYTALITLYLQLIPNEKVEKNK
jgi:hypothetical protein